MTASIGELARFDIKPGQKLLKLLLTQIEEFLRSWTDVCSTAPSPWKMHSVPIGLCALIVKSVSPR